MPSNHLILSCPPFLLPSIFPSIRVFPKWVSSLHQVAKVLELQLQHQSFQWIFRTDFLDNWLVWSPCSPRDSQKSSPTPQFKSISSSVLSLLYGPTFTSVPYFRKLLNSDKILLRRIFWNFSMYTAISLYNNYFIFSFWSHVPYIFFSFFFFLYQPGHLIQCWLAVMLLSIFGLSQFLKGKWLIFYHNCEVRSNTQDKDTPFFFVGYKDFCVLVFLRGFFFNFYPKLFLLCLIIQ